MSVSEAAARLETALRGVAGLRVYRDPGATVEPPAALVGPPSLEWGAMCLEPSMGRFTVYVLVTADDRALERLWDLVPTVAEAVDRDASAAVVRADPSTFNTGGSTLPAYELTVEVPL